MLIGRDHPAGLTTQVAALPGASSCRSARVSGPGAGLDQRRTSSRPQQPRRHRHSVGTRLTREHVHPPTRSPSGVLDDLIGSRVDDEQLAAVIQSYLEHRTAKVATFCLRFEVKPVFRSGADGAAQIVRRTGLSPPAWASGWAVAGATRTTVRMAAGTRARRDGGRAGPGSRGASWRDSSVGGWRAQNGTLVVSRPAPGTAGPGPRRTPVRRARCMCRRCRPPLAAGGPGESEVESLALATRHSATTSADSSARRARESGPSAARQPARCRGGDPHVAVKIMSTR